MENLSNSMNSPDDDAGERLVSNEEKNSNKSSKDKTIEVKYMTPDSQNGDAKIDIENLKTAFAGMGKEELMKYANDPFWVKMRWFLFILFWLVWIAMLVGAIAIIVLAPKCSAPSPREWWEQSPLYQIDVRSFKDGSDPQDGIGDLKGLESKLDYLKELGVKTIVLSSLLKSSDGVASTAIDVDSGNVVDYKEIDDDVGTLEQFKQLADAMKNRGLYLLMSFIPNHSSDKHPFFIKSVDGDEEYKEYYVWASPKGYDPQDGSIPLPPNNWLSRNGGSAWQWNEKRKMFYLHQFDKSQPDFNFHNPKVVDYFKDVMKFWLANGVSGFHLDKVQYLLEDSELRDEPVGEKTGFVHDQYEFLNHKYTSDLDQLNSVLQQWNEISANNSGILSLTSVHPNPATQISAMTTEPTTTVASNDISKSIGQLFMRPQMLQSPLSAVDLVAVVNSTLQLSSWPTWEFVCESSTDCIKEEVLPGLQVVSLLLPGTTVTRSGSELGAVNSNIMPWDNSTNGGFTTAEKTWRPVNSDYADINVAAQTSDSDSQLSLYRKLLETRKLIAIMHGNTNLSLLNDHVFTFTRIKPGNPGLVIAFNIHKNKTTVDLTTHLKGVPSDLTVVAQTKDRWHVAVNETSESERVKSSKTVKGNAVTLDGYAAIVLQFVPTEAVGKSE